MKLSILTPTLLRTTMSRTLTSIATQTFDDFEWLIAVDLLREQLTEPQRERLAALIADPHVRVHFCPQHHADVGHSCRHELSRRAQGEYLLYLDDDDYLADENALGRIAGWVESSWMIFPALREGQYFFSETPARCATTLSSFIVQREHGQFPDPAGYDGERLYQLDATYIEGLLAKLGPPQVTRMTPPVVIPTPGFGRMN